MNGATKYDSGACLSMVLFYFSQFEKRHAFRIDVTSVTCNITNRKHAFLLSCTNPFSHLFMAEYNLCISFRAAVWGIT